MRQQGKTYNILTDRQFAKAMKALASKRKQLRQGKGQRPKKALGLSSEQIDKLWSTEQLSNKSTFKTRKILGQIICQTIQ